MTENIKLVVDAAQGAWVMQTVGEPNPATCHILAAIGANILALLVNECGDKTTPEENLLAGVDCLDELLKRIDCVREALDTTWHTRVTTPK